MELDSQMVFWDCLQKVFEDLEMFVLCLRSKTGVVKERAQKSIFEVVREFGFGVRTYLFHHFLKDTGGAL